MLRESIGERLSEKTNSAKHKIAKEFRNTKNAVGSVTSKKLKVVKGKFDDLSLKRKKDKNSFEIQHDDRPQTISMGDKEMMNSLTFNSPLNNRSYNLENLSEENTSTYEIPKSYNRRSAADLPSYDDVVKDQEFLKRNTNTTQSLYSQINKTKKPVDKAISDSKVSNLSTISSDSSESSDEHETEPPNMPAPELPEQIYGKIRQLLTSDYENAPIIPLRRAPGPPESKTASNKTLNEALDSDKATVCGSLSERSSIDPTTSKVLNISCGAGVDRSESWRYVDNVSRETIDTMESEDEPIYTNDENEKVGTVEPTYGEVFNAKTNLLLPLKANKDANFSRISSPSVTREILNEFDPLSRESFDNYIMKKMNHLSLLETLLSEETYGTVDKDYTVPDEEQIGETSSVDSGNLPTPPERDDSLAKEENDATNLSEVPKVPQRTKKSEAKRKSKEKVETPRAASVIIHQNLRLKADSIENLVDAYSARSIDDEPSTSGIADLSRPKPTTTNWFVEDEANKFLTNNLDNPNINQNTPTDKLAKTIPQLSKVNNFDANREHLPTYEESKNDEIVSFGVPAKSPEPASKSKMSLFSFGLKRNSSFKDPKPEAKNFVPRPPIVEDNHQVDKSVILFKLPSGVIEDILKELNPRFVEVKHCQFKAYSDPELKVLKEHLDLNYLASIQFLVNHKFTDFKTESGRQIHCFEINLAMPKNSSNSNALLDSKGVPVKTQRVTYVYGIHSKNEK
jgi:Arf-GAP with Rho-GAP domain, ANK repeat and PH domain-containing protein 1